MKKKKSKKQTRTIDFEDVENIEDPESLVSDSCRICLSPDQSLINPLTAPCYCKGTF